MKLATSLLATFAATEKVSTDFSSAKFSGLERCPWEEMIQITCLPNSFDLNFTDEQSMTEVFEKHPHCMKIDDGLINNRVSNFMQNLSFTLLVFTG